MNLGSATHAGRHFVTLQPDAAEQAEFSSVSGQLAVLMLETEEHQKQLASEQLSLARHEFSAAVAEEVRALRDQADAQLRGALFAAGTAIVAGGMGAIAAGRSCDDPWQKPVGVGLGQLSQPLGTALSHDYGIANAKSAQAAQEAARWQIDDARREASETDGAQDKALDWLSAMVEREAAAAAAILANKV